MSDADAGVGRVACRTGVPVVHARIFGAAEAWPKNSKLPNWNAKISVVYGEPLMVKDFDLQPDSKERYQIAANRILEGINQLSLSV